ncbi:MAG: lamin tail domain-containing protein, partial [Planctomycetes bacterium]|nr:lamin tail domain-containing protein [Planctomycetota bacterium]
MKVRNVVLIPMLMCAALCSPLFAALPGGNGGRDTVEALVPGGVYLDFVAAGAGYTNGSLTVTTDATDWGFPDSSDNSFHVNGDCYDSKGHTASDFIATISGLDSGVSYEIYLLAFHDGVSYGYAWGLTSASENVIAVTVPKDGINTLGVPSGTKGSYLWLLRPEAFQASVAGEIVFHFGLGGGRTHFDGVLMLPVGPPSNQPPNVNAGDDQQVTLPIHTVIMDAAVTDDGMGDPDGYLAWQWSQVSGPKDVEFELDVNEKNPTVRFPLDGAGVYVLRLTATDGALDDFDEITITVNTSTCPLGDLSGNCLVDGEDLMILGLQWLDNPGGSADLTGDDTVDNKDYAWVVGDWQKNWQTGAVQVSIYPVKARGDGAQWRVDSGSWRNHDYIESGIPTGTHTVEFASIADWDKPNDQVVEVTYGEIAPATGTYIEHTGSLRVNISPPDVLPTAKWRRMGETTWRDSGSTENDVPAGPQYVEFTLVTGWRAPGTTEVGIEKDTQEALNATYVQLGDTTLRINEFMATNSYTPAVSPLNIFTHYEDLPGVEVHPDWIELYNTDPAPVSLEGWYLTDSRNDLQKWRFPAGVSIAANGYLVLFASNKEQIGYPTNYPFVDYDGVLHTNFELDGGGEYLALVWPDGLTIAHEYDEYPKQRGLISYGIASDENPGYLLSPTPGTRASNRWAGAANSARYLGVVADTQFSHDRGFYDSPFDVTISCATSGAEIYYTTDGSEPSQSSSLYASPINISTTTCLRAAAFKTNWLETNVDTQTYIFLGDVLNQDGDGFPDNWGHAGADYEMDPQVVGPYSATIKDDLLSIATMSLVMDVDGWFDPSTGIYTNASVADAQAWQRHVSVEFIDPVGSDDFQLNAGVQIQGGSSTGNWKSDKLSMRLKFKGGYVPSNLNYPLFGADAAASFNSLILDARLNNVWNYGNNDGQRRIAQYTRDQYVADIQNAMGGFAPYGRHVHLYINGLYWGLYNLHERPDDSFGESYFGGSDYDYDVLKHSSGNVVSGTSANYIEMLGVSRAGLSEASQYQLIQEYLDVPSLIDYMITNFYVGNTDWDGHNWYATRNRRDPAGRWRFHSWDAEHVLKGAGDNVTGENTSGRPSELHQDLTANEEYRLLFADHLHRHFNNGGVLSVAGATALYQVRLDEVDRAVVGESARWGDNREDQTPFKTYTRDVDWVAERDRLLNTYFTTRTNTVLGQLGGRGLWPSTAPPTFNQHGGAVPSGFALEITAPAGTIYYTLDGSDPRQTGGAVGGTAYSGQITLTKSVIAKARVLDGGTWSALTEATFGVGSVADDLRITEIMYHPTDPTQAEKNAAGDQTLIDEDFEFIEFKNIGTAAINLNLVNFTDGIDFTFGDYWLDAGQFAVIVQNQAAFQARYPGVSPALIAGTYTGALDNDGEEIVMRDTLGAEIHDFDFNDTWFVITDGGGYSLNKLDPDTASNVAPDSWDTQSGWRPGSALNGTPGADDTGYTLQPGDVVISEIMTHTDDLVYGDWIEIWNKTGSPVYIGGWFLSDNELDLRKYEIAAGDPRATIAPDSYVVFDSVNDFRNSGDLGSHVQFGLSEHGEDVYLTSGSGGVLTGEYSTEQENFGAAE